MGLQLYVMQPDLSSSRCGSQIGGGCCCGGWWGAELRVGLGCPRDRRGLARHLAVLSGQPQQKGGLVEGVASGLTLSSNPVTSPLCASVSASVQWGAAACSGLPMDSVSGLCP